VLPKAPLSVHRASNKDIKVQKLQTSDWRRQKTPKHYRKWTDGNELALIATYAWLNAPKNYEAFLLSLMVDTMTVWSLKFEALASSWLQVGLEKRHAIVKEEKKEVDGSPGRLYNYYSTDE